MTIAAWIDRAIKLGGVPILGITVPDVSDKSTWRVDPPSLQGAAQPIIDAFDPGDPAHAVADLDAVVLAHVDDDRLISAVVWTIIDTYSAPATVAKYLNARTKIIACFKSQPWKT